MANRSLELTIISAKGLNKVNLVGKMDVYAVVYISGPANQDQKQKTHVDVDGDANPTWNYTMKFQIDEFAILQNRLTLVVKIKTEGLFGDKDVGEVHVPIKELLEESGKPLQFVSYQVRKPSGKPKGELSFSYKFDEKVNDVSLVNDPVTAFPVAKPNKPEEFVTPYSVDKPNKSDGPLTALASGSGSLYPPPYVSASFGAYPPPAAAAPAGYPPPAAAAPAGYPRPAAAAPAGYPRPAAAAPAGYPPAAAAASAGYPSPAAAASAGYPPAAAAAPAGYSPPGGSYYPPPAGYPGYANQHQQQPAYVGYAHPPPPMYGGYPPPQPGYGYPLVQQPPQPRKKNTFGMGVGAGLLGGALGGLLIGDIVSDAADGGGCGGF